MFSMPVDVKDSNEVEVKALSVFPSSFHSRLVVESYSMNTISWVSSSFPKPWKSQLLFNEIKLLSFQLVEFFHLVRLANSMVDT